MVKKSIYVLLKTNNMFMYLGGDTTLVSEIEQLNKNYNNGTQATNPFRSTVIEKNGTIFSIEDYREHNNWIKTHGSEKRVKYLITTCMLITCTFV